MDASADGRALAGTVALVTGAGRGIGRGIAAGLAEAGAQVGIVARSAADLQETEKLVAGHGARCVAVTADVRDRQSLARAVDAVTEELGPIDLLVNNAGANTTFGPTWEVDAEQWWSDVATNLLGPFLGCQLVLPSMIERGRGRIVNIVSNAGAGPFPNNTAYACSKLALIRLTDSLAQEVAEHGVVVFALSPGSVASGMPAAILESESGRRYLGELISGLDFVEPTVAAQAVVFLAGGAGDGLNGRFFRAVDDVAVLAEQAGTIEEGDFYQVRWRVP
jgi:NAD(P)-dependent dehydrogenase (short-subunit alcohol dehydrogenase family)